MLPVALPSDNSDILFPLLNRNLYGDSLASDIPLGAYLGAELRPFEFGDCVVVLFQRLSAVIAYIMRVQPCLPALPAAENDLLARFRIPLRKQEIFSGFEVLPAFIALAEKEFRFPGSPIDPSFGSLDLISPSLGVRGAVIAVLSVLVLGVEQPTAYLAFFFHLCLLR